MSYNDARRSALARDNHQCQSCGSTENLTAHHILPVADGGTNRIDNLVTLCRLCHDHEHRLTPRRMHYVCPRCLAEVVGVHRCGPDAVPSA